MNELHNNVYKTLLNFWICHSNKLGKNYVISFAICSSVTDEYLLLLRDAYY